MSDLLLFVAVVAVALCRVRPAKVVALNEMTEYCQNEHFEATCGSDQVVIIEKAQYGRIELGRCIKVNFGFVGCGRDVTGVLERTCSGRNSCNFEIKDPNFRDDRAEPCNPEFKNHLWAKYTCLAVTSSQPCEAGSHVKLTSTAGVIASSVAETNACGTRDSPYLISVAAGQTVNLSLLDFSEKRGRSACLDLYAKLHEPLINLHHDVCNPSDRSSHVYTSRSHQLQLILTEVAAKKPLIFEYHAVGCADVVAEQPSTSVERVGSKLTIRCNTTKKIWTMLCRENSWVGETGNCTQAPPVGPAMPRQWISLPTGLLVAVVIGIALTISLAILLLGIGYLRRTRLIRRHQKSRKQNKSTGSLAASNDHFYYEQRPCEVPYGARSELAFTWESPDAGRMLHRPTSEKLYTGGTYHPLPCRCVPIKLKEVTLSESPGGVAYGTVGRSAAAAAAVIVENNASAIEPDVVLTEPEVPELPGVSTFKGRCAAVARRNSVTESSLCS